MRGHSMLKGATITGTAILLVLISASAAIRISGKGEAVGDLLFGSSAKHAPTSTPQPGPAFTQQEVLDLTTQAVAGRPFPDFTDSVRCTGATFRTANRVWMVTCEYEGTKWVEPPGTPCPAPGAAPGEGWMGCAEAKTREGTTEVQQERTWLFDDESGEVR